MRERLAKIAKASGRSLDDVLELWSERAAIRQYDGGLLRGAAEREAVADVEQMLLQVELPL